MTSLFVVASLLTAVCTAGLMAAAFAIHGVLHEGVAELRAQRAAREPDLAVADAAGVTVTVEDLGDDPLNPHGDGTLRPGDALFDAAMSGEAVLANRREDGLWNVQTSAGER